MKVKLPVLIITDNSLQGPTNRQPGRPGQAEKITGQVFYFSKKPAGPLLLTDELMCANNFFTFSSDS